MYSLQTQATAMATDVIRSTSGTQPPGHPHRLGGSDPRSTTPLSSAGSQSSHRNKQLLKSYHDFTMQIFSSGPVGAEETDALFVAAVRSGEYERVENLLQRRSHEIVNIDARDMEMGNTALMWAVLGRQIKTVRLLLKYGADVTLRNSNNDTVLDLTEDRELRKILLESVLRKGVSPRHLLQAAWQGNVKVVKQLLNESKILDINCRNGDGFTPLLLVTRDVELFESIGSMLESYDPVAVIEELLRHRADPVATDNEGHSPLHHAASTNSPLTEEMALRLMRIPVTVAARDVRSQAPIHTASQSGSVEVVVALLDKGVDVNTRGYAGTTPLHVSASAGQTQVANTLLSHGADVTLVDDSGNTAVDVAKNKRIKSVLREAWTEATDSKVSEELGPVKPPSRMDSQDDLSPRTAGLAGLLGVSPPSDSFGKRMLQKMTDAHKAVLAEEQMLKDIESGRFTPGVPSRKLGLLRSQSRNSPTPSPGVKTPLPPRTPRVLDPLSNPPPSKTRHEGKKPRRSLTFSGRVNSPPRGGQRSRGHDRLEKTRSDPTAHRLAGDPSQIPVTVVGLALDESLRDVRFQRMDALPPSPGRLDRTLSTQSEGAPSKLQRGTLSHPRLSDPAPSDVARAYQTFCNRSIETSPALAQIPSIRMSNLLNLEQMNLGLSAPSPNPDSSGLYPMTRTVLPHTPSLFSDTMQRHETIFEFENEEGLDGTVNGKNTENEDLRLNLGEEEDEEDESNAQQQPLVHKSVMFNIEASRVNPLKDSSDSGQGSSRSTVSHTSSSASIVVSSPSPQLEIDRREAAKNRLGIKMTPLATKVPDERIALFQRAQQRLPSLGRASPAVNPSSRQRKGRKTSEDCISVLSMSSVNAQTLDLGDSMRQDELNSPAPYLMEPFPSSHPKRSVMSGKRKISLEDHSALVETTQRSPPTADDNLTLLVPDHLNLQRTLEPISPKEGKTSNSSLLARRTSKENSAVVTPLCATTNKGAKALLSDSSTPKEGQGKNLAASVSPSVGSFTKKKPEFSQTSRLAGKTAQEGGKTAQNQPKASLVRLSKPAVRTLEVLPGPKVDPESGKRQLKEAGKTLHKEQPNGGQGLVDSAERHTDTQVKSMLSSGSKLTDAQKSESQVTAEKQGRSLTKETASGQPKSTAPSKGESVAKNKKVTSSVVQKDANKSTSVVPKAEKKTNVRQTKTVPVPKTGGKCAINIKESGRVMDLKTNTYVRQRKDQGKSNHSNKKEQPDLEDKKESTWRITCDDDDSSGSDFEMDEQRFNTEQVTAKEKKAKAQKKPDLVPASTRMNVTDEDLESSDAEDVFEEVAFSEDEDEESMLHAKTKSKKSNPQEIKLATKTPQGKNASSGGKSAGVGQSEPVVRPGAKGKGTANIKSQLKVGLQKVTNIAQSATNRNQKGSNASKTTDTVNQRKKTSNVPGPANPNVAVVKQEKSSLPTSKNTPHSVPAKVDVKKTVVEANKNLTTTRKDGNTSTPQSSGCKEQKGSNALQMTDNVNQRKKTSNISGQAHPTTAIMKQEKLSVPCKSTLRNVPSIVGSPKKSVIEANKKPTSTPRDRQTDSVKQEAVKEINEVKLGKKENGQDLSAQDRGKSGLETTRTETKEEQPLPNTTSADHGGNERSEVTPLGQDHVDPAVRITTSAKDEHRELDKVALNPTSPRDPKKGVFSYRKGKYKSPNESPRDPAKSGEGTPQKKRVTDPMAAKPSPVIMDIVEMFKTARGSPSPSELKLEVLGKIKNKVASVKEPVKKIIKPKKASAVSLAKGGKARGKERVGSGGRSKGRVGSGGSKGSEASKGHTRKIKKSSGRAKVKKKVKDVPGDLRLVPDAEQNTTAFITGQGWTIKTSRNESDDVIIRHSQGDDSSSSEEDGPGLLQPDLQLSPHNSLKLDQLVVMRSISTEEKKNLANILSPLEMNAPMLIPDTMDTIKEFADSLKSTSSSEPSMQKMLEENSKVVFEGTDNDGNGDEGSESLGKGEESSLRISASAGSVPSVQIRKSSIQSEDSGDVRRHSNTGSKLSMTGELSVYGTNPDLMKVFRIGDHYETLSPRDSRKNSMTSEGDEEQVRKHLSLILSKQPDSGSDAGEEAAAASDKRVPSLRGSRTEGQEGENPQLTENILKKKPPLPKLLQQHQIQSSKKASPRRSSEPTSTRPNLAHTPKDLSHAKEENKSQVSPIKNSLPDKNFSPPNTTLSKKRGKSLEDLPPDSHIPLDGPKPKRQLQFPDKLEPVEGGHNLHESEEEDGEDDPLTRHVQTITEKTLQEFSSVIANSPEKTNTSVIVHSTPPSTVNTARSLRSSSPRTGDGINVQGGEVEESEFLNQSLGLSETSSEVFRDFNETGESGASSHTTSMSSSMVSSTERSLSVNTNLSESEGTELLHWKKGNLLGKGAFGTVYCGLTNTGQLLAVKQVELSEKDKTKAKQQYQKLQEEVQLLKTLRHRNIVGFLGVSLEDNTVNIFMQFIPGGSIASLLARFGSLDEPVFCRYTKQILEGTQYLHGNNVIHRDIKGANIMLMSNGVIKLIDFGCAKRLCIQLSQSQNVLKSMRGTPYWMAPEVIMETGHGKKSDIWSVGCTVFEMATRKPPWAEMPPMSAIFAIGSGNPVPQLPGKFSEDAKNFVNACLTREQTVRPTAEELLQHPFIRRRRDRTQARISTSTSLEDGPIVFREQPISRDSAEGGKGRRNYAPAEFR